MATSILLGKLRDGDEHALHELLVRHLEWVRRYVHRRLDGIARRHADTGDIVHEVVVRVLRHGPRFVVESEELFRRLLGRIVTNTLASTARRAGSQGRSPQKERAATSESVLYLDGDSPVRRDTLPPERAAKAEEHGWIDLGLELLDPADRAVLVRRDWEGRSFAEIGAEFEMQEDAARMRYKRAVRKLTGIVERVRAGRVGVVLDELDHDGEPS